jgi:HPr kinase/phosphorylase
MDYHPKPLRKASISVAFMVETLRKVSAMPVEAVNEVDAEARTIAESNLHRPGLALAGFLEVFTHQRVQILGNTECGYLRHLDPDARREAFRRLLRFPIPCIILTENNDLGEELLTMATEANLPVFRTPVPSTDFMSVLYDFLGDQFAPQQSTHGALVDVYGIGLLLIGKAGIGKSELALDLVERGHRLVADDVVMITKKGEQVLMGTGTDLVQHFMEVRGLGLIDVRAMFGVRSIRNQKRVEVVVSLESWDANEEYTRISMVDDFHEILGVDLPLVRLPITPGKNVTVLCEVIAMNYWLRHYGYDPAKVFSDRLSERIRTKGTAIPTRSVEYFEHDYE